VSRKNLKITLGLAALFFMAAAPPTMADGGFPEQPILTDYLQWAVEHHPGLGSARARSEVSRQNVAEAGALPDLKLAWGEMIVPVETRVGPQQRIFSVSQSLPWFGTLGEAETAADFQALAAQSMFQADSLAVEHEVRKAWFELARLQQELVLTEDHFNLSRQSEQVALRAYETGSARFRNVLQAQMESENLANRLESLQARLVPATVKLNTAAGLPAVTAQPTASLPMAFADPIGSVDLQEFLHSGNPNLESLRRQEESQRHLVEAARLSGRPGLTLGLDYIMTGSAVMPGVDDSGKDPVIARLAINVPLWSGKATARRLASASRLQAVSYQRSRLSLDLDQQYESLLYQVRDSGRSWQLYEESLLPRAKQILSATTSDYETGRATFDEVIGARENLLGLELARLRATADQALALSNLEVLLGAPVESLLSSNGNEF
jgi:outer membrane protein, heavy metal efflux system